MRSIHWRSAGIQRLAQQPGRALKHRCFDPTWLQRALDEALKSPPTASAYAPLRLRNLRNNPLRSAALGNVLDRGLRVQRQREARPSSVMRRAARKVDEQL